MKDFTLDDIRRMIDLSLESDVTGDYFLDVRYDANFQKFGHPNLYWRTFYHLTRFLQPTLTVELGAWQATAAAHLAAGWREGTVITIDHHTDPGDDENKRLAEEAANRYPNLIYLQGWTWDRKETVANYGADIDILFIDSWHQYEYAMRDWNDYSPLLGSPALVICDDLIGGNGPVIAGMKEFWNDLPGEKFLETRIHPGFPMGFIKL